MVVFLRVYQKNDLKLTENTVFFRFTEAGAQKRYLEFAPAFQDLIQKAVDSCGRKVSKNDVFAMFKRGGGWQKMRTRPLAGRQKTPVSSINAVFFRLPIWWG